MLQAGVANLRASDVQLPEVSQLLDVLQSGVRGLRAVEMQRAKASQPLQVLQASVGYPRGGACS